ncbi:uncharacterized protein LOC120261626 [Dioscorea cayenensis subsp. rotundata]|uniref:Uncharacterized protein LOC120261626 n=1 Tax=Dioscorea cayennensis subsp. rotundata TaxID=55577 RepID=A0AB40BEE3_DIOCR|nr:uncharacterized protein LOC120261626 [Dioscorea cayenensis subsp. rotundata]
MNNTEGTQGEKRKGTPNKRWTKEMDNVLIPLLADMARSGLKVDKSFKRQAFVDAANVVNSRFPTASMDADNVENHMRTLKQKYQDIKKLMNLSGVGWNDTEKKLVLEDETYRTYVEGQPKAKEYLNKPIPFFEELRLVAGMTTLLVITHGPSSTNLVVRQLRMRVHLHLMQHWKMNLSIQEIKDTEHKGLLRVGLLLWLPVQGGPMVIMFQEKTLEKR